MRHSKHLYWFYQGSARHDRVPFMGGHHLLRWGNLLSKSRVHLLSDHRNSGPLHSGPFNQGLHDPPGSAAFQLWLSHRTLLLLPSGQPTGTAVSTLTWLGSLENPSTSREIGKLPRGCFHCQQGVTKLTKLIPILYWVSFFNSQYLLRVYGNIKHHTYSTTSSL